MTKLRGWGATQARLSLHLSKCHIVGNHMSRLKFALVITKILQALYRPLFKSTEKTINFLSLQSKHMSHDMRCPPMWYVRPAKAQTSSLIRAFASRLITL